MLNFYQTGALTSDQMPVFQSAQLNALTVQQITALNLGQVQALSTQALLGITKPQIMALSQCADYPTPPSSFTLAQYDSLVPSRFTRQDMERMGQNQPI